MTTRHIAAVVMTALLLLASGCGGGSDESTAAAPGQPGFQQPTLPPGPLAPPRPLPPPTTLPPPITLPPPVTLPPATPPTARSSVEGTVMNAATGALIANATVQSGTATATTTADGRYTLGVTPGNRVVLNVTAAGFADGMSVATVAENETIAATTKLLPIGITVTISNATGGTVTVPGTTAAVILPPGAFGSAGQVRVELTVVSPAQDASQMPGDYVTQTGQLMESAGAIIVTPRDATSGARLQLAAGKTATIRIPLSTRGTVTPTTPLFFLNTAGAWVQEGTATLMGTAPDQYYEGTVTHFTAWNADRVYDSINVRGCVMNPFGTRVFSGVSVTSDGIDYSGTATARTDLLGNFVVPIKKGASATITGFSTGRLTNSISVGPSTTDIVVSTCLVLAESSNSLTMRLTWGAAPRDVDSHLFTPSGAHVYFIDQGSLSSAPFASLDVDDVTSFGPEIVTITRLMEGTYTYGVHNFSGEALMTPSPVRVELNIAGRVQVFTLPAGETVTTSFTRLFQLNVDARCNITVTPVNTWEADVPAAPTPRTPTFCSP